MRPSNELEAVVRRFLDSRIALDLDAMEAMHSTSEYVRQIGSDRDEWGQGPDESMQVWIDSQSKDSWRVADTTLLRIEAFENGDTGWAAVEQERTLVHGQVIVYRITMVFLLERYSWKLVQIHFSIPVADEQVLRVDLTSSLNNLLTSLDGDGQSGTADDTPVGTLTTMFTDVVDSTAISQSIGDKEWSQLINAHFDAVRDIIEGEGGSVVKTIGDGGMYVFGSATSALRAGVAIQQSVAAADGVRIRLRVGIHTGEVLRSGSDYVGLTVSKAARVAAAAQGGQVLVSSTTVDLLNTVEFTFDEAIIANLKGIDGTHLLLPLRWHLKKD